MNALRPRLRETAKCALHRLFVTGQAAGWDLLPRNFYSNLPDISHLMQTEYWRRPIRMPGVAGADLGNQLEFLRRCCPARVQQRMLASSIHKPACQENGEYKGYGEVESDFLFAFIMTMRPPRIVQVGAGVSTAVILMAAEELGYRPEIVCIDPFPTAYLGRLARMNQIELVQEPAETVDMRYLAVRPGDLLFIDSTHTVKPGGEVNRLILEVLPDLPPRCYVHFHDIYFPYDYPPSLFNQFSFGNESTLLHAFLIHNRKYRISLSLSMLHHQAPEALGHYLPNYRRAPMKDGLRLESAPTEGHFPDAPIWSPLPDCMSGCKRLARS